MRLGAVQSRSAHSAGNRCGSEPVCTQCQESAQFRAGLHTVPGIGAVQSRSAHDLRLFSPSSGPGSHHSVISHLCHRVSAPGTDCVFWRGDTTRGNFWPTARNCWNSALCSGRGNGAAGMCSPIR
jgi:hypothetical protein